MILEPKKIKSVTACTFSLFAMKWWDRMPWSSYFECWVLSQLFQSPFSPLSRGSLVPLHFLLLERIICLSKVVDISPGNLDYSLWFIQAFCMMYSAYKLNIQGGNIQPCHTPFPVFKQSVVPCKVLTVASWPTSRFLRKQVRWSDIPTSLRIFQFVDPHSQRL